MSLAETVWKFVGNENGGNLRNWIGAYLVARHGVRFENWNGIKGNLSSLKERTSLTLARSSRHGFGRR